MSKAAISLIIGVITFEHDEERASFAAVRDARVWELLESCPDTEANRSCV